MTQHDSVLSSIRFSQTADWNIKQFFHPRAVRSAFALKRVGDVLTRRKDQMTVEDSRTYKRITIKTNCGGVAVRDEALGQNIKTKSQYFIRAGQLAVSKIDARNGAFGVVPPEADGAIITGNFWVYDVNPEAASIDYLVLLLSSDQFVRAWQDCSNGSGNRLYLQEKKFLNYQIPMPSVAEQLAIIDRYHEQTARADCVRAEAIQLDDSIDGYLSHVLGLEQPRFTETNRHGMITATTFKNLIGWGAAANSRPIKPQELFQSSRFENLSLEHYCEINPKTVFPEDIATVSFVPMECVSDVYGEIEQRRNGDAAKSRGYTTFQEKDVIWAKITPCMQNGKCAVANGLEHGFGYGSTEFHVFRANENALPEYIYCLLRSKRLRNAATRYFTGSAGQQRVGVGFFKALTLPKLPVRSADPSQITQETVAAHIFELKGRVKALHQEAERRRRHAKQEFDEAVFGKA